MNTPITVDATRTTLGEFLDTVTEKRERTNILRCLRLTENGVSGPGKEEMEQRLVRAEGNLALGDEENLSLIFTTAPESVGTYKIEMRKEIDYRFQGAPTQQDPRFKEEEMAADYKFACILTSLTVVYNTKSGNFTQDGSFGWWVKTVH